MHPYDTHNIADQAHAERIRRAAEAHREQLHRRALPSSTAVRSAVGDLLVRTGTNVATLGQRIATAKRPSGRLDSPAHAGRRTRRPAPAADLSA